MSLGKIPCNDYHYHSSFLPRLVDILTYLGTLVSPVMIDSLQTPISGHEVLSEGNVGNILEIVPFHFFVKLGVFVNIHI